MAKKRRLDQILENRQKAKQNASNSGNIRQISTGLPTTRQQMVMPRRTTTEVQALAQSLYNRRSDMTAEQQKVINVAQNYTPIKQNGLAQDNKKSNVQKAISSYNPNFRETGVISKDNLNQESFLDKVKKETDPKTQQKMLQQYNSLFNDNKSTLQVRKEAKDEETVNKINNGTTAEKVFNTVKFLGQGMIEGAVGTLGQINATAQNISRNTNYNKVKKAQEYANSYQQSLQNVENGLVKFGGQVTNTVGAMLPSIGMNLIAPGTGNIMAGVSAGSSAYLETLNEGQDNKGKAMLTGVLKGTLAGTIEKIIGGNKIGTGALDDIAVKNIAKVKSQLAQKLLSKGYEVVGEVGEENLENFAGYLVDMAINNKKVTVEDAVRDLIDTTGTTAGATLLLSALGLGGGTFNDVQNQSNKNNQIKNSGLTENQQQKLTEVAQKYDLSQADIQNLIDNTKNGKYDQKQATTMENKAISNQSQQVIQTEGKIDEKAISQEVEQELKNTNYKREESVKRAFESAKKYNIDTKSDTFKEKIRIADERGVDLVYDASVFGNNTNQNAVWKIKRDENGKIVSREIVFNPNAKGDMTLEQVWTHEITHDMEGNGKYKTMRSELLEYLQAKPEYEKAFNDLKAIYAKVYAEENLTEQEFNELIEDEVVADMLGSKLGDTEFLKSLNKEKRSLGKRIYDWVVDRLNRLNKKKGYTNEKLFWQDIKNKFENAYKEDFADSSMLTKYSVERDNKGLEGTSSFNLQKNKEKQLEIILKNNPMHDDYHTGIRTIDDIKTYQEALNDDLDGEIQNLSPDFKANDLRKALETGEVTVYSSYPIEQGVFVTPSKMEAGYYAGDINKVYSKKIKLSDVAWIDTLQGQYAKVEDTKTNDYEDYLQYQKNALEKAKGISENLYDDLKEKMEAEKQTIKGYLYRLTNSAPIRGIQEKDSFMSKNRSDIDNYNGQQVADGKVQVIYLKKGDNEAKISIIEGIDKLWIDELYIKNQKQGYGREIVEAVKQYASEKGLIVDAFKELPGAVGFWDKVLRSDTKVSKDNQGRTLSKEEQDFIKDNGITDKNGNALELYHGTPYKDIISEFDSKLAGSNTQSDFEGIYFTDNKEVAEDFSYQQLQGNSNLTYKRGEKGQVINAYLKAKKPLNLNTLTDEDIDNLEPYIDKEKAIDGVEFALNTMKQMNKYKNAQGVKFYLDLKALQNAGYDALIADMGGNYKGSNEYIVFNSTQIKTKQENSDVKYSLSSTDNQGRTLSKEQQEYFKDSKVRDENGNLLEVYHGSKTGGFNVFDSNKMKTGATLAGNMGDGFYFTDNEGDAVNYSKTSDEKYGQLYKVYLDIKKPFVVDVKAGFNKEQAQILSDFSNTIAEKYKNELNKRKFGKYETYTKEQLLNLGRIGADTTYSRIVDEYGTDFTNYLKENGYDGIIHDSYSYLRKSYNKNYIAFNSNQIKNVDNTNPTENPDIRYSLSQETKANLEAKIDRYSKLVEEMQQDGKDAEEWAPYANEILRLQDQLDGNRFSRESTGAWNDFKNKYGKNEGKGNRIQDITLEQPKKISEVLKPKKKVSEVLPKQTYETILAKAEYISKEEKQAILKEAKENNFSLEEVKETVQQLNDYYKQQDDNKLDTNKTYATGRNELYSKYMNKNTKYDNSSLNRAKELIKANNQGRRTKEQWLNIAKQIGTDIANKSNSEIEEIAYRTWQDERPNLKESLNRQGEKYVKFTSDEWINTIYNEVKKQRELQPKQTTQAEKRQLVDEVYREDIAEGKVRKHYKSVFDSDQVGKVGKDVAKELLKKDTYVPISNLETITAVNDNISRNGIGATYNAFRTKVRSNEKITLQDVATGERLIQIYSQKGDYAKVNELIQDVAILGTELGQQVQALSLIKRASPEGQLQYLTKLLERTNIKENTNIKITDEMTEKILGAKNQEDLEKKLTEVAVELAEQLPVSKGDMIRSWRYLSMLGNPKTHIKNLGANVAMNLTQRAKNAVAGAIEGVASVFNPEMERTKTIKFANREQKQFAKQDAELMKDLIDAGGKYNVKNVIQESKKQFNNKVLNAIADFNSNLLDVVDKIFLKSAYKVAMQNYMSANNLKASDMEGKTLEKARQYASLQAQEATFHEFNEVAQHLSQIENKGGLVGGAMSAILPFKKTPMNIAKAGVQYSPVGLASAVTYDIAQIAKKTKTYKQQLADGKITEAEYKAETSKMVNKSIDNMAKGLTGTSLAVLGYALAKMGVLKAGNDGEDDEFKQKLGEQEYAITIGDNTYTLDWVSPSAIPIFTGASIYQLMTGDVEDQKSVLNSTLTAFSKTFEPMTDMSMLQGLTSAITSYEQGSSNMIFDLGASMVTSYAGQFVPTVAGQVARIADPYERDTSSTKKGIEGKVDKFAKQTMNKIPGLSRKLPKKTDVWGEDVKRPENLVQRTLETAVLPWTIKSLVEDRTAQELLKVFDESGENVLPGNPNKDLTINKIKYRLTTEEYNEAKRNFGQTSKALLDDLFKSKTYNTLTAEGKAKAIDDVYAYAKEKIKVEYAEDNNYAVKPTNLYNTISSLEENNADVSAYFEFKGKIDDLDREKGEESVKNKEKMSYLKEMKTDAKTKRIIYEDTLGTNDEVYQNLSKLTGNKVNINQYLDYKTAEIKGIDDPKSNVKGKTVSGSKKKKVVNYLNNSDFTAVERLYIYGTQYSFDSKQKTQFTNYIDTAKKQGKITSSEAKEIYKKLNSVQELEDGRIRWK